MGQTVTPRRARSRRIVVVGSINLDVVCPVDRIPQPGETVLGGDVKLFEGGKGANQAVGVARLGHPVSLIGRVGADDAGARLSAALARRGVDVGATMTTRGVPSGMALIATDRNGQNSIVVSPGANARLTPADVARHAHLVQSATLVLLQLEIPLATVLAVVELAERAGVPVMLDPAPARPLPRRILQRITWLTPNESEAVALCDGPSATADSIGIRAAREIAEGLRRRGPRNVIITLGRRGCCVADDTGITRAHPAFPVRAVDTTAAGDAFNAGLAVALSRGQPLHVAVEYASAVAALAVTRRGAQPSMPGARSVARFVRQFSR